MTDLATATERLLNQVRHWEQPRWSANARADRMHTLIQHLADLTADAEHRPRRPVPREHDLVLPDQLRVVSDDLLLAAPPPEAMSSAVAAVDSLRTGL